MAMETQVGDTDIIFMSLFFFVSLLIENIFFFNFENCKRLQACVYYGYVCWYFMKLSYENS